uniref:Uncharacterized protein n=1 Tax=Peronospora matthiolae TaxID=2874970 RepID=A0AAV1TAH6_9STRA
MSVRREVVSLSQLLRRSDSSVGRQHRQTAHGPPPPPPLALQTSRQRLTKPRLADQGPKIGDSRPPIISSAPFTDKPRSFTQKRARCRVRFSARESPLKLGVCTHVSRR